MFGYKPVYKDGVAITLEILCMGILCSEWMDSFHDQWKLNLFLIGNVLHLTCMFGCMNCTDTQLYAVLRIELEKQRFRTFLFIDI